MAAIAALKAGLAPGKVTTPGSVVAYAIDFGIGAGYAAVDSWRVAEPGFTKVLRGAWGEYQ